MVNYALHPLAYVARQLSDRSVNEFRATHFRRAIFASLVSLSLMQILRIVLAALLAIAAAVAGLFTAAVVAIIALVAYLALLIKSKTGDTQPNSSPADLRRIRRQSGEFIDVVASEVEEDGVKPSSPDIDLKE
jgi:hypothetical protein